MTSSTNGRNGGGFETDVVTREIVRGKLLAVADEMGVVLARSSMSPVIYEVLDFACGFCDADGELVSQTNGITVFTGTFSLQINIIKEKFAGRIRPGDIYMLNDPFHGGTHYNDVGVVKPVFVDGELFAFAISISHWTDIGGKAPGSLPADATEIFQEGICFPGIHVYKEGERQDAIFEMIAANVRLPKMALGDLNAALASVRIAENRCLELCEKYGKQAVAETFRHILETSERVSREAVAALPDGTYEAEDWIDGDGITEERFRTKVAVTIAGDDITVDYTGSCDQLQGPVNCSRFCARLGGEDGLQGDRRSPVAVQRRLVPAAEGGGAGRHGVHGDQARTRGLVLRGHRPGLRACVEGLGPIAPKRVSMGSANSLCVTVLGGHDRAKGEPWVMIEPSMVGWGATDERDGNCVTSAITNGDTFNYSIELLEAKFRCGSTSTRSTRRAASAPAATGAATARSASTKL